MLPKTAWQLLQQMHDIKYANDLIIRIDCWLIATQNYAITENGSEQ